MNYENMEVLVPDLVKDAIEDVVLIVQNFHVWKLKQGG